MTRFVQGHLRQPRTIAPSEVVRERPDAAARSVDGTQRRNAASVLSIGRSLKEMPGFRPVGSSVSSLNNNSGGQNASHRHAARRQAAAVRRLSRPPRCWARTPAKSEIKALIEPARLGVRQAGVQGRRRQEGQGRPARPRQGPADARSRKKSASTSPSTGSATTSAKANGVTFEGAVPAEHEVYFSITDSTRFRAPTMTLTHHGGMDIEELDKSQVAQMPVRSADRPEGLRRRQRADRARTRRSRSSRRWCSSCPSCGSCSTTSA